MPAARHAIMQGATAQVLAAPRCPASARPEAAEAGAPGAHELPAARATHRWAGGRYRSSRSGLGCRTAGGRAAAPRGHPAPPNLLDWDRRKCAAGQVASRRVGPVAQRRLKPSPPAAAAGSCSVVSGHCATLATAASRRRKATAWLTPGDGDTWRARGRHPRTSHPPMSMKATLKPRSRMRAATQCFWSTTSTPCAPPSMTCVPDEHDVSARHEHWRARAQRPCVRERCPWAPGRQRLPAAVRHRGLHCLYAERS